MSALPSRLGINSTGRLGLLLLRVAIKRQKLVIMDLIVLVQDHLSFYYHSVNQVCLFRRFGSIVPKWTEMWLAAPISVEQSTEKQ